MKKNKLNTEANLCNPKKNGLKTDANLYHRKKNWLKMLILAAFFVPALSAYAQHRITGSVADSLSKESVEAAVVKLLTVDSALVKGVITDSQGRFTIDNLKDGKYILVVSAVGYDDAGLNLLSIANNPDLGIIYINPGGIVLKEVTVQAASVVQKDDRQLIFPTAMQKRAADNGFTLLRNLQLPAIHINPISRSIEALEGGNVAVYLNGAPVSVNDIAALTPDEIVRIEYHDNPGMRYNNAPAVIDFITRRRVSGGIITVGGIHTLSDFMMHNDNLTTKYNYKKSEIGFIGSWMHKKVNWIRENEESFVFPDQTIRRTEVGLPTKYMDYDLNGALNYNLRESNKYMLNVNLRSKYTDVPNDFSNRVGTIYSSDSDDPISVSDLSDARSNTPSLDIYYQQNLKNKQILVFNVVGTHISSKTSREYLEKSGQETLSSIVSQIDGKKNSLIAEGIYEKRYDKGKLTGGFKHSQSHTENQYSGNVSSLINMNVAETYAYMEYLLNAKKFSYTFGLGGTRNETRQTNNNQTRYIFRPKVSVSWNIASNFRVRYSADVSNRMPALADMNEIEQAIDSFQIRRGNPLLLPHVSYNNNMSIFYNHKLFTINLSGGYNYAEKPIMESILPEARKFVIQKENQKNNHRIFSNLALVLRPVQYISLNLSPGVWHHISNGKAYSHEYTNFVFTASVLANYKNWAFYADMRTRKNNLTGEIINYGERMHTFTLMYNSGNWSVGAGMINPFTKEYSQSQKNLSRLTPSYSKVASNEMGQIVMLNFNWIFNWGVKYESERKRMENTDSDSGIMSGKKEVGTF